jgi:hypothetical protein
MRLKDLAVWLGPVVIAGLSTTASEAQQTPKREAAPCFNDSCPIEPVVPGKRETAAPEKPYDWKASFATYKVGKIPRMPDGKPSLQGIWSRSILTPVERPGNQTDKAAYDESERTELEDAAQQKQYDLRTEPTLTPPGEKTTDAYNTFWRDGFWYKVPMTSLRTSQVVDPPDGRLPPITPAAREQRTRAEGLINHPPGGPEDRPLASRCVRPLGVGPAFTGTGPGSQETTFEIVQGPQAVVVRAEALRSQVIYLDGRPRPPADIHLETGAARGHWEGDTLVVEYTNFSADALAGGVVSYTTPATALAALAPERRRLTERWKRLDDTHLLYGFTLDDPGTRTKPYSIEFVLWRLTDQEQLVEYACHEGNVNLEFTLSGARAKEKEDEEQPDK